MQNRAQSVASVPSTPIKNDASSDPLAAHVVNALPSLALIFLVLLAAIYLRNRVGKLLDALTCRLKGTGSIKIGPIELGEIRVPTTSSDRPSGSIRAFPDPDGKRAVSRAQQYQKHQKLFVAHRLFPSRLPGQTYDIWIYLVGHKRSLDGVKKVEYFMGSAWGNQVFTSEDRGKRFGVLASAYGSGFLCLVRIHLCEGDTVDTWRYVDFEEGSLGKE